MAWCLATASSPLHQATRSKSPPLQLASVESIPPPLTWQHSNVISASGCKSLWGPNPSGALLTIRRKIEHTTSIGQINSASLHDCHSRLSNRCKMRFDHARLAEEMQNITSMALQWASVAFYNVDCFSQKCSRCGCLLVRGQPDARDNNIDTLKRPLLSGDGATRRHIGLK